MNKIKQGENTCSINFMKDGIFYSYLDDDLPDFYVKF